MKELFTFFIESILVSASFYGGLLIIKNHTTPTFKRFYLLIWMICSITFPLISIESDQAPQITIEKTITDASNRPEPNYELKEYHDLLRSEGVIQYSNESLKSKEVSSASINWSWVGIIAYLMVTIFFLIRIVIGMIQIFRLRKNAIRLEEQNGSLFQVNNPEFRGASFFRWIFIGENVDEERDVILRHEQIHGDLFHSLDILLSHVYCAFFWINPLSWILKKQIGLNTEFEVDTRILVTENKTAYANMLLSFTKGFGGSVIMNHFGAFHLKSRILALSKINRHKKWVSAFSLTTIIVLFFLVSCEPTNSSEVMNERLGDVKTITTRFISHQSDTKQKTGKIVAIASFAPDGSLEELVEQTTYPYDREFEVKKVFWESPEHQEFHL